MKSVQSVHDLGVEHMRNMPVNDSCSAFQILHYAFSLFQRQCAPECEKIEFMEVIVGTAEIWLSVVAILLAIVSMVGRAPMSETVSNATTWLSAI